MAERWTCTFRPSSHPPSFLSRLVSLKLFFVNLSTYCKVVIWCNSSCYSFLERTRTRVHQHAAISASASVPALATYALCYTIDRAMASTVNVFVLSPDTRSERRYDLSLTIGQLKVCPISSPIIRTRSSCFVWDCRTNLS